MLRVTGYLSFCDILTALSWPDRLFIQINIVNTFAYHSFSIVIYWINRPMICFNIALFRDVSELFGTLRRRVVCFVRRRGVIQTMSSGYMLVRGGGRDRWKNEWNCLHSWANHVFVLYERQEQMNKFNYIVTMRYRRNNAVY